MSHLVFVNQFFYPDESATSLMLTDCVRAAAESGVEVEVVCSRGGYSGIGVGEGRGGIDGVKIHRVAAPGFARGAGLHKVLSYGCFVSGAAWRVLRCGRGDMVVSMTTPPLLAVLGRLAQMLRGARHVIWEMDVYPDVAVELGVLGRGTLTERIIGFLADWPRHHADAILALGSCMRERLIARGIDPERITITENWANGASIRPEGFRRDGRLKLLYSGNLGLAHEFGTLAGAIEKLGKDERFRFRISGSGPQKAALEDSCRKAGANNTEFGAFQSLQRLPEMLAGCDAGLVTQKAETCGTVVPSKVYGILAAGRPLIYIGPAQATPARLIAETRCGWQVDNGDVDGLVELLGSLADSFGQVEEAGQRARAVFEQRCDVRLGTARVLRAIGSAGPAHNNLPVELAD